jgi:hypothetical protein
MEVSNQLYTPAELPAGKEVTVLNWLNLAELAIKRLLSTAINQIFIIQSADIYKLHISPYPLHNNRYYSKYSESYAYRSDP